MKSISARQVRNALPTFTMAAGALGVMLAAATTVEAGTTQVAQLAVTNPSRAPATTMAAATPTAVAPVQQADARASLEAVGPGDLLRINVFRNPDLTTEARVNEQGAISFPLIGDVPVTGLSAQQVGKRIADKLSAGRFVVNPEVTVSIAQVNSRQVSVLGNVNKPGRYPIDAVNVKLTDFIAAAGGVAGPGSDIVTVVQNRAGQNSKTDVDLNQMFRAGNLVSNIELQPGDTIYVHRAPVVYVYGEVQKAGAYRLEPHMTVMQAIAMGGGLTPRGTQRGLQIHRRSDDGNVKRIDARLTDEVRTDDVVYVQESLF